MTEEIFMQFLEKHGAKEKYLERIDYGRRYMFTEFSYINWISGAFSWGGEHRYWSKISMIWENSFTVKNNKLNRLIYKIESEDEYLFIEGTE